MFDVGSELSRLEIWGSFCVGSVAAVAVVNSSELFLLLESVAVSLHILACLDGSRQDF